MDLDGVYFTVSVYMSIFSGLKPNQYLGNKGRFFLFTCLNKASTKKTDMVKK